MNGHGGYWVVDAGLDGNGPARNGVVVHNATYEVVTEVDVRQTRTIGCGGWTEGLPRYRRVVSATFFVAERDTSYPQVLGFTEGAELSTWLKRGSLWQFDLLALTLVKSVRVTNGQQKARGVEIVCQHGRYHRAVNVRFSPGTAAPGNPDDVEE